METPKFNNSEIQRECKVYAEKIKVIRDKVSEMLIGRQARIISNFNGQPYGTSKPSLKGKVITVKAISIDSYGCQVWDGNFDHVYLLIDEVEFLEGEH
jgi:hypothetical protein